jgi:hypothetical protein
MSQPDNNFTKSFDQNRKAATQPCDPQIRELLSRWYGVSEDYIINVEGIKDGAYDPGVNDLVDKLDYRGVDWLVPKDGLLIPVGARLRTGGPGRWRWMTLRARNGTGTQSEAQTIRKAIDEGGIYPRDYALGIRQQWDVHRAVLWDTADVSNARSSSKVRSGRGTNDDGSAYIWFNTYDLFEQDCAKEVVIE